MPGKNVEKTKQTQRPRQPAGPAPEELQAAYQIHTLAQLMYGRIHGTQWPGQTPRQAPYSAQPTYGRPWVQGWPAVPGHPFGWDR